MEVTGRSRRALEHDLPASIAWAAYSFITERLPPNPHRLGGPLSAPDDGRRSARLGTYRVVYRIDEDKRTVYVLSIGLDSDGEGGG